MVPSLQFHKQTDSVLMTTQVVMMHCSIKFFCYHHPASRVLLPSLQPTWLDGATAKQWLQVQWMPKNAIRSGLV